MRTVVCEGLGTVSALGFGCASLGSRISTKVGRAAIDRALAAGVTWFDVAPSYGDGKAEEILGQALRGSSAVIVTKVGLVAPPGHSVRRAIGAIARPLVAAIPGLRPLVKKLRPDNAKRVPLTGEIIHASVLESLDRLGRQNIGVLALHDPSIEDVRREDVIAALTDIRDQGLAGRIAVTGPLNVFEAALAAGLPADVAQFGNSPFTPHIRTVPEPRPFTVTHSVFGVSGALSKLSRLAAKPEGKARLRELGYERPADMLMDYAFAANPDGVVIASGYDPKHLAANAAAAARAPRPDLVAAVDAWIAQAV